MSRIVLVVIAIGVLSLSTGCRNRCANPCGNGGFFAGSPTIAAPATYSLNIPSVARNPAQYYVPNNGTLQTNTNIVPATGSPIQAGQRNPVNGWVPTNQNPNVGTNGVQNNGNTGRSVLTTPTTFVQTNQPAQPNNLRTASASNSVIARNPLPGSGTSFTDSINYRTTQTNEQQDRTRLPATDASNVRAPARNFPTGGSQFAQLQPQTAPISPVTYQGTFARQQYPVQQPYQLVGQPVAYQAPIYVGQPQGIVRPQSNGSQPAVLAQSTTTFDPNNNGSQLGWRDREFGSNDSRLR